jgi:hypothetical protein
MSDRQTQRIWPITLEQLEAISYRASKTGRYLPFGMVIMIASSLPSLAKWCSSYIRSRRARERTILSSFGL